MVEILADSLNLHTGDRLTTVLIPRFWKPLQAELRTHRMFSQSHYSSRAIPMKKVINQVIEDPYMPILTRYAKGMGGTEDLDEVETFEARVEIKDLSLKAVKAVEHLIEIGLAKQDANRYLEPWMHGACVVTGDEEAWRSFFKLRIADGVQPDMRLIAEEISEAYRFPEPRQLTEGQWHIPFYREEMHKLSIQDCLKVSAARCARVSYLNHEGQIDFDKDFDLHDRLIAQKHMTPFEHQAQCRREPKKFRNFSGWMHYRQHIEEEIAIY